MSLRTKSFWIFDLDGTLTLPVHDFEYIRRELDIPAIADILGYLDSLPETEAGWRHARLQEIEIQLAHKAEPSPGAIGAIAKLHQSGAQLGVLTRNDRDIKTAQCEGNGYYGRQMG